MGILPAVSSLAAHCKQKCCMANTCRQHDNAVAFAVTVGAIEYHAPRCLKKFILMDRSVHMMTRFDWADHASDVLSLVSDENAARQACRKKHKSLEPRRTRRAPRKRKALLCALRGSLLFRAFCDALLRADDHQQCDSVFCARRCAEMTES